MNSNILINFVSRFEFRSRTKYRSITRVPTSLPSSCNLFGEGNIKIAQWKSFLILFDLFGKLKLRTCFAFRERLTLDSGYIERALKIAVQNCSVRLLLCPGSVVYPKYWFVVESTTCLFCMFYHCLQLSRNYDTPTWCCDKRFCSLFSTTRKFRLHSHCWNWLKSKENCMNANNSIKYLECLSLHPPQQK